MEKKTTEATPTPAVADTSKYVSLAEMTRARLAQGDEKLASLLLGYLNARTKPREIENVRVSYASSEGSLESQNYGTSLRKSLVLQRDTIAASLRKGTPSKIQVLGYTDSSVRLWLDFDNEEDSKCFFFEIGTLHPSSSSSSLLTSALYSRLSCKTNTAEHTKILWKCLCDRYIIDSKYLGGITKLINDSPFD